MFSIQSSKSSLDLLCYAIGRRCNFFSAFNLCVHFSNRIELIPAYIYVMHFTVGFIFIIIVQCSISCAIYSIVDIFVSFFLARVLSMLNVFFSLKFRILNQMLQFKIANEWDQKYTKRNAFTCLNRDWLHLDGICFIHKQKIIYGFYRKKKTILEK